MSSSALRLKLLTMLCVVGALILTFVIFFKISSIEVSNAREDAVKAQLPDGQEQAADASDENAPHAYYTREEIIAASGIEAGDNLLTLNKAAVASRIKARLPYIDEVQIKRSFPNGVTILVTEFEQSYAICDEAGGWWLISRDGTVLEQTQEREAKTHICVSGTQITVPSPGETIRPAGAEGADVTELAAKKDAVIRMLQTLEANPEIEKHVVSVDVSASYDIVMMYGTQYEVRLGTTEELVYKFAYLQGVLREFEQQKRTYLSGVIDITFSEGRNARFQPFG